MDLEQTPAARSLDVFVIRDLAQRAAEKLGSSGDGHFEVDLIAGQYVVSVDVLGDSISWVASQVLDDGRLHVVAMSR